LASIGGGEAFRVSTPDTVKKAEELHAEMHRLRTKYEAVYLEISAVVYAIFEGKTYREIKGRDGKNYETQEEYFLKEFGMSDRKARYLRDIHWWFCVENDDPGLVAGLREFGWSKCKELVGVVTSANATQWFELARNCTKDELALARRAAQKKAKDAASSPPLSSIGRGKMAGAADESSTPPKRGVKGKDDPSSFTPPTEEEKQEKTKVVAAGAAVPTEEERAAVKQESGNWQTISFRILKEWSVVIKAALKAADQLSGGRARHDGYLLDLICTSFCGTAGVDVGYQRDELLARLEEQFGVSIIAVEEPVGRIVYGEEAVARLSGVEVKTLVVIDGEGEAVDGNQ